MSDTWICSNCGAENSLKFCTKCGAPKPVVEIPEADAPQMVDTWDCICGNTGNTGKFCKKCGRSRAEGTVIEAVISENEIPQVEEAVPEVEVPEVEVPELEIPEVETPEVEVPQMEIPEVEIPEAEIEKVPAVKLDGKYIGIYHHWDGYPEGVGDTLVKRFNTYEDALNLLLYGDESSINSSVCIIPYILRGGGYKKAEDTPPHMYDRIPANLGVTHCAEFVYLFKDGEWYFDTAVGTKKRHNWEKVDTFLKKYHAK